MNRGPNLSVRLWDPVDGDSGAPRQVFGIPVDRTLATRSDAPGALVALRDHRVALTGSLAAVGRHRLLRMYVRGRSRGKSDERYRAWLTEVADVLERMQPESKSRSRQRQLAV